MGYKHILAAIDTTEDATEVLSAAQQLAEDHGATLSLVMVIKSFRQVYSVIDVPNIASLEEGAVNEARKCLIKHARTLGLTEDRVFVLRGNPAVEIRNLAKELDAGAIVIGTHGRDGVSLMFLGSTVRGVLCGASCDVLAIRIPQAA
jgi:universal stress protein A